jgi:transforming growth factor-beta-induced protein
MRIMAGLVAALFLGSPAVAEDKTIVEIAASNPDFETLVAAVKAAGLVDTLNSDGPFTVLAPTDAAFERLGGNTLKELLKPENKEKLASILKYHVIPGKVMAADVVKLTGREVDTACPDGKLTVQASGGQVQFVGKTSAKVIKADIQASNGVIHVIDTVLLPPSD